MAYKFLSDLDLDNNDILNSNISGGGGSGGPAEFVRVSRSTNQTISDSTGTDVIFDTEEVDTGGWFDIGSPTDITVTEDGIYNVSACAQWDDNVSGYVQFAIRVNGTSILVDRRNTVDDASRDSFQAISGSLNLTSGDVVTFNVFQETGGNLDIVAAGGRPILTMAKLETGGGSGSGGGSTTGARVTKSGNQTIPNNTSTVLTFDQEDYDTENYHDNVTNNSRLTIPEDGFYVVTGNVEWTTNTTGNRSLTLRVNGSTIIGNIKQTPPNTDPRYSLTTSYEFSAGDYVELFAAQTSGGNLDVEATVTTSFSIVKVTGGSGGSGGRELLTANRTYYVNDTLGSDSNDGLTTGAGAFQTIQKAVDTLSEVDTGSGTLTHTINVETSLTLSSPVVLPCLVGAANVEIIGDTGTPSNRIITVTGTRAFQLSSDCRWTIKGFRTDGGTNDVFSVTSGRLELENIDCINYGTRAFVTSNYGNLILIDDIFVESIGASDLILADRYGQFDFQGDLEFGPTTTFTSAIFRPRFSAFGRLVNTTYSGTTGAGLGNSCRVDQFSVLDTASGSTAGLPGNGTNSGTGGAII